MTSRLRLFFVLFHFCGVSGSVKKGYSDTKATLTHPDLIIDPTTLNSGPALRLHGGRSCGDTAVGAQLRARDPAGRGLPSATAVRLLRALLSWNPGARPTAEQARGQGPALQCSASTTFICVNTSLSLL